MSSLLMDNFDINSKCQLMKFSKQNIALYTKIDDNNITEGKQEKLL